MTSRSIMCYSPLNTSIICIVSQATSTHATICVALYSISVKINKRVVETYTSSLLPRTCPPVAGADEWPWSFNVCIAMQAKIYSD